MHIAWLPCFTCTTYHNSRGLDMHCKNHSILHVCQLPHPAIFDFFSEPITNILIDVANVAFMVQSLFKPTECLIFAHENEHCNIAEWSRAPQAEYYHLCTKSDYTPSNSQLFHYHCTYNITSPHASSPPTPFHRNTSISPSLNKQKHA